MVKVKVCGVTRETDARLACELGAAAVGFVFWEPSPRYIAPDTARGIVKALPAAVTPVGVFVDAHPKQVAEIAQHVRLGAVQLHGSEDPALYATLSVEVIKAIPLRDATSVDAALDVPETVTVLLDAHDPVAKGGTGRPVDWTLASAVAQARRVFLAGGLAPTNVVAAIRTVRPYGVDVSSGVEEAPGVKGAARLRAFFAAVARSSESAPPQQAERP